MDNANHPGTGRTDNNPGPRNPDPNRPNVTGQKDKPGIGQPGRGGDDLSGRGTHHDDATRIDDRGRDKQVQADAASGDRDKFDSPGRAGNESHRGESPDAADTNPSEQQMRSGQPLSTGEETLGGNQGAM